MSFDPTTGLFVRPGGFRRDQSRGEYFTSERADQEFDAVANALTEINKKTETGPGGVVFNPQLYYTRAQQDAMIRGKQDALGFTPINLAEKGRRSGVAPLDATGKIDRRYLPTTLTSEADGVQSFNGRTGIVGLEEKDVTAALGYQPASEVHSHAIAEVTGLQTALNSKQAALGFTPANVNHAHIIGDITGLQAILDTVPQVYTGDDVAATVFPIGHIVAVQLESISTGGGGGEVGIEPVTSYTVTERNQLETIRLGPGVQTGSDDSTSGSGQTRFPGYTTAPTGAVLSGQWRSRGAVGVVALFQRVS